MACYSTLELFVVQWWSDDDDVIDIDGDDGIDIDGDKVYTSYKGACEALKAGLDGPHGDDYKVCASVETLDDYHNGLMARGR